MDNLDEEIRLKVRTKSDRPVMNAVDTPEYVNLATHFNENKANVDKYESIQFTENSASYVNTFEDEALLRGEVKPVVVKKSTGEKVNTIGAFGGNYASKATADGTVVLPYQDIPGNFASVDTLTPKIEKQDRYFTVPASIAIFYNPLILIVFSLLLVFLIFLEIIGCIYVF